MSLRSRSFMYRPNCRRGSDDDTNAEKAEPRDVSAAGTNRRGSSARLRRLSTVSATSVTDGVFLDATSEAHKNEPSNSACGDDGSSERYTVLPRLSGYALGDPLREQDRGLCQCKKAASYAMNKLRLGDCAFVVRSNGTYTYAHYEGYARRDLSSISFKIDNRGHYKLIPKQEIASFVKIPVLIHHDAVAKGCRSASSSAIGKETSLSSTSSTSSSSGTSLTADCRSSSSMPAPRASSSVNQSASFHRAMTYISLKLEETEDVEC